MLSFKYVVVVALVCLSISSLAEPYDLVIRNGRVIDPETKLDAIRHVGVRRGSIVNISKEPLNADKIIDATGLVVAPGFIDLHSHTPSLLGQHMNLLDGVTTQLDLEAGAFPISFYGEHYRGGAQLNYGASVGHSAIRAKVMEGEFQPYIFVGHSVGKMGGDTWLKPASQAQIEQMRVLLEQGLADGGLGIGVLLDYMTEAVSDEELRMVFDVAAKHGVPVFVHVRRGNAGDPAGLIEVITLAKATHAPLFICHITHNAMGRVADWLAMIDQANREGAIIATETLSYAAGGTSISADVFRRRNWQEIFDITYEDVQWVATGEWLTEDTWNKYASEQPHGMVNHHYVKEDWLISAMRWPDMMISSDALPALDRDVLANPNVSGTFSRVLGHYVRDKGVLSLGEAVSKLSLLQAKWMERTSSDFARKGRIQLGADADIVIFDPATIAAKATYGDPYQKPDGIRYVLVAGRVVVEEGERVEGRYPGKKILGEVKQ